VDPYGSESSRQGKNVTLLSRFLGLYACMFYLEHGVPHVHIYFGSPSRSKKRLLVVEIANGNVIKMGREFPRNRLHPAMHWTFLHRRDLLEAWAACRQGRAPSKITPLPVGEFSPLPREMPKTRYDDWGPCIRRLDRLGEGRVRVFIDDGRVFERSNYRHAATARLVDGGHAVKRNRTDFIYEGARGFVVGRGVRRVR
jgi:hypothetical protein